MNRDPRIIPLHRGRPFIAPSELSRSMGDADAIFRRFDGPPVIVDLAPPSQLRELWRDVVEYSHVLTIGIIAGALGTVGLAFAWAALS